MDVLALLVIAVLLAGTVALLSGPLRRAREHGSGDADAGEPGADASAADASPADPTRAELEAAKEDKYREIRETELDHATGKLSDEDFRASDRALRAEAAELLARIDALEDR